VTSIDRETLKALDRLIAGNHYTDEDFDGLLPYVQAYLDGAAALRTMPLSDVPNALVAVAGGRK
jgi:hypothetical protein